MTHGKQRKFKTAMAPAVWTGIYHKLPLHDAFTELHQDGWRAFEISTEHLVIIEKAPDPNRLIAKAVRCIKELNLYAPQAHALLGAKVAQHDARARKRDIKRLASHLRICAKLGVRVVVMHPGTIRGYTTRSDKKKILELNVAAFRHLGDLAGELGLQIGLENLSCRDAATPYDMLGLLDAIDHPAIGLTLDTSHASVADLDPAEMVREFDSLLIATHISDNDGSGDQHLTPGSGRVDWRSVMSALRQTGYKGLFNLEIPGERHSEPVLQRLKLEHARKVVEWLLSL